MSNSKNRKYLQYLPDIYQVEEDGFLGRFLKAFENILSVYSLFRVEIKDPAGLASKLLHEENPLSLYIKNDRFLPENQGLLDEFKSASLPSDSLQKALTEEFKNLLLGGPIYETNRFQNIKLSAGATELLKLNPGYLFNWDDIPGKDNNRLIEFLNESFDINWVKSANIIKIDNGRTIKLSSSQNFLSLELNDEKTNVSLRINNEKTQEFIAITESGKLNIYNPDDVDLIRLNLLLLEEAFPYELTKRKGIEEILDQIHIYFNPLNTPLEFLPWLAGWMALVLKEEDEWNENNAAKKRDIIAKIIPLYQKRGTLDGLRKFIIIYVGEDVKISINEFLDTLQVGVSSTIGTNTAIREGRPYYFQVYIELPTTNREILEKRKQVIRNIINLEKPAHTYYYLIIVTPPMQIGVHSKVGVDTLLGGMTSESMEA